MRYVLGAFGRSVALAAATAFAIGGCGGDGTESRSDVASQADIAIDSDVGEDDVQDDVRADDTIEPDGAVEPDDTATPDTSDVTDVEVEHDTSHPVERCDNGVLDGDETDLDCGGTCKDCASGKVCGSETDCATGLCEDDICQPWRATQVVAGAKHACALVQGGRIICWGDNGRGQAGADPANALTRLPGYVGDADFAGFTHISAGAAHTCAIRAGEVYCWGDNARGQLGRETASDFDATPGTVPRTIVGQLSEWTAVEVAAGRAHTCAAVNLPDDRPSEVYCWGDDQAGQMGRFGPTAEVATPKPVMNGLSYHLTGIRGLLQAGADHTCIFGTYVDPSDIERSSIDCWGSNEFDQLGEDGGPKATPVFISFSGGFEALAVGAGASCWLRLAAAVRGKVSCIGKVPANDGASSSEPVQLAAWTDAADVAVDKQLICAVHGAERAVSCVGDPETLGYSFVTPTAIGGLDEPVSSLEAGEGFACAWQEDGDIRCWGRNDVGQLGNGTGVASPTTAQRISP